MYAGEVGVPRLLKLFDKYGIKQTFNIPGSLRTAVPRITLTGGHAGHSLDTFPEQMAMIRDAGHEM